MNFDYKVERLEDFVEFSIREMGNVEILGAMCIIAGAKENMGDVDVTDVDYYSSYSDKKLHFHSDFIVLDEGFDVVNLQNVFMLEGNASEIYCYFTELDDDDEEEMKLGRFVAQ